MKRCEAVVTAKSSLVMARRCWGVTYLKKCGKHWLCKTHRKMWEGRVKLEFSKEDDGGAGF
jgi:hypothetical protein